MAPKPACAEEQRDVEAAATLLECFRLPPCGGRWRRCDGPGERGLALPDRILFETCGADRWLALLRVWKQHGRFDADSLLQLKAEADELNGRCALIFALHMGGDVCKQVSNLNVRRAPGPRVEVHARGVLPLWEPMYPLRLVQAAHSTDALEALGGVQPPSLQEVAPWSPEVLFTGALEGDVVVASEPSGPSFFIVAPQGSGLPSYERVLRRLQEAGRKPTTDRVRRASSTTPHSCPGEDPGDFTDLSSLALESMVSGKSLAERDYSHRLWSRLERQFAVPDQLQLEGLRRSAMGWLSQAALWPARGGFWRSLDDLPRSLRLCMESEEAGELSLCAQVRALSEWLGEV